MTDPLPRLSRTEWAIMNLCWKLGPATARQVHEASLAAKRRDYRTVKTLLDRLAAKGYLAMEKLGPLCIFKPRVTRPGVLSRAIDEFVGTVLDHKLAPFLVHLADDHEVEMSEEEIAALTRLLERQRAAKRDQPKRRKGR